MFRLTKKPIQSLYKSNIVSFNSRRLLGDGANGQKTWPSPSYLLKNYGHSTKNLMGWAFAISSILIIWPTTIVGGFKLAHHVPSYSGSQVQLKRIGLHYDTTVEIPQTYVHLTKGAELEDEY